MLLTNLKTAFIILLIINAPAIWRHKELNSFVNMYAIKILNLLDQRSEN